MTIAFISLHVIHVKCLYFVYLKRGFWLLSLLSGEVSDLNRQDPNTFEMNFFSFKYQEYFLHYNLRREKWSQNSLEYTVYFS